MARQTKARQAERQEAIARLRGWLKPGATVYTVVRQVSRSGMSRRIDCYYIEDGKPRYLTYNVGVAIGASPADLPKTGAEGLRIGGCGMDMGFAIVYDLAASLYPKGFTCTGKHCPSNDHANGDRNYRRHKHEGFGYALHQRWL